MKKKLREMDLDELFYAYRVAHNEKNRREDCAHRAHDTDKRQHYWELANDELRTMVGIELEIDRRIKE